MVQWSPYSSAVERSRRRYSSRPTVSFYGCLGKTWATAKSFDPTRLSENEALGIVPENTTLTIAMRVTNPGNSNLAAKQLNTVIANIDFEDKTILNTALMKGVRDSLEVENELPITVMLGMLLEEMKQRIYDTSNSK